MRVIEPSVSEREAEKMYPTQYWEGTKTKRSFDMTTDDQQDAYMRGREAEPCAEQVEAVARILFEESWSYRPAPISFDEFKAISKDKYTDEKIEGFRRSARMLLNAARKAVM